MLFAIPTSRDKFLLNNQQELFEFFSLDRKFISKSNRFGNILSMLIRNSEFIISNLERLEIIVKKF